MKKIMLILLIGLLIGLFLFNINLVNAGTTLTSKDMILGYDIHYIPEDYVNLFGEI